MEEWKTKLYDEKAAWLSLHKMEKEGTMQSGMEV
uniref:Uncharacterized protein n=1 Tax=Moniliophthora roreri TaxID=221103 RepID=A0A0W0FRN6_MONRR